jgi:hypothetical protein
MGGREKLMRMEWGGGLRVGPLGAVVEGGKGPPLEPWDGGMDSF